MRNRRIAFLLAFLLLCCGLAPAASAGGDPGKGPGRADAIEKLKKASDGELKLTESGGNIFLSGKLSDRKTPGEKAARQFLEDNKALFGIEDAAKELKKSEIRKDEKGHSFVRFVQTIGGVEVEGSLLNVHFDRSGSIASVNGSILKNRAVDKLGDKSISGEEAVEIAKRQFTFDELQEEPKAEKFIIAKDGKNYEAYRVNISYMSPEIANYSVYVEASSGEVIRKENNIRHDGNATGTGRDVQGVIRSLNLYQSGASYLMADFSSTATAGVYTYSMDYGTTTGYIVSNATNRFDTEYFKTSVSAHYFAGRIIDFYKRLFNRNSLDGKGMAIRSFTHYGVNYSNAFWTGTAMVYGDGDGEEYTYFSGSMDVVAHEMTHGVVTNTANLYYHNQSGALNESIADTFGVMIETYDEKNVVGGGTWSFNPADWIIGEEIKTPGVPGDAERSMADPTLYDQPAHMDDYVNCPDTPDTDMGGVHINSGIPNRAAFLVARSIGMQKTASLYYRALTQYLGMYSDFADAYAALLQSAIDLYGAGSAEAAAVTSAFTAVGIYQGPVTDPFEPNDTPATAYQITSGYGYRSYISTPADIDYYRIDVAAPGTLHIALTNLPADYDLVLINASTLSQVAISDEYGTVDEVIDYAAAAGTYYIRVVPYGEYSTEQMYALTAVAPGASAVKQVTGVTLNAHEATLNQNRTLALAATVSPADATNKAVTWRSNNPAVATVSDAGVVTSVSGGMAVITVRTQDSNYTDTCIVTVTKPATGVSLDRASASLVPGELLTLVATVTPADASNQAVTWASSNTAVATVSTTGRVKALKAGTATIRVTTADGGVQATCAVTVAALKAPAAKVAPADYKTLTASWTASPGASGYEVFMSTSATSGFALVGTTSGLSFKRTGLTLNKTYYFKVRSYKNIVTGKSYSAYSNVAGGKPQLSAPALKAVSAGYNRISISWSAVPGATRYCLYRATSPTGRYSLITTTTALKYSNTVATGKTYYYKVRVYRLVGSAKVYGGYSAVKSARAVPAAPASVSAVRVSSRSIKVAWGAVAGATKYEVWRRDAPTGAFRLVTTVSGRYYTNPGLVTGRRYYYEVRAYRLVSGKKVYGPFSRIVTAVP